MRARNLKPGFFKNEDLAECQPLARILLQGLWCLCDREGRLEYRPKRIKAEVLPYDEANIEDLLHELAEGGFIVRYEVNSVRAIWVPGFLKHNAPHVRESASTIPPIHPGGQDIDFRMPEVNAKRCKASARQVLGECSEDAGQMLGCLNPESGILNPEYIVGHSPNAVLSKNQTEPIPYSEIVEYLNAQTGKQFQHNSQQTMRLIKARWNQGFRVDDFKRVIDAKCSKWLHNAEMVDYLRPATLFGSKFEGYLNENWVPRESQSTIPTIGPQSKFKLPELTEEDMADYRKYGDI